MPRRKIIPYRSYLKPLARKLRANMTYPERLLWSAIRRRQVLGIRFLRQQPIDRYIVDFYAQHVDLVIEVDGRSHDSEQFEADMERQQRLESFGLTVLRFSNDEIIEDVDAVTYGIADWIERHSQDET